MLLREAKDWKGQDHYAVLGITKYRYKATEEQIKRAHRKKVLRHHPDKKAAAGSTEDDSFFKCIQKATDVLLDPVKRRQYDSVDQFADVPPPTKKITSAKDKKFYKIWSEVFASEGRFSNNQPVPPFGDAKSDEDTVNDFYNFFYNFDSWRSFEYQDEDVPDDGENRDQKRHTEKKNNNARKKKKTEDVARLRKLVDQAMEGDERIKRFRDEKNAAKNAKKLNKEAEAKKALDEAKAKKEAEEKSKKDAEEAAKAEREQGKKAKEAAKTAVKKNRRVLKGSVTAANYFANGTAGPDDVAKVLADVETVQGLVGPTEIAALAGNLNGLTDQAKIKAVWSAEIARLVEAGKATKGQISSLE
jgi:DnaJ family protein C protein 2